MIGFFVPFGEKNLTAKEISQKNAFRRNNPTTLQTSTKKRHFVVFVGISEDSSRLTGRRPTQYQHFPKRYWCDIFFGTYDMLELSKTLFL